MQAKYLYTNLNLAVDSRPKPFAAVRSRMSTMRQKLEGLCYRFDDRLRTLRPELTYSVLDKQLRETSLLAAELMELAEFGQEECEESGATYAQPALQRLADACFDVILEIDGERQEAGEAEFESIELQLRSRENALACAINGLDLLDRRLGSVLAD